MKLMLPFFTFLFSANTFAAQETIHLNKIRSNLVIEAVNYSDASDKQTQTVTVEYTLTDVKDADCVYVKGQDPITNPGKPICKVSMNKVEAAIISVNGVEYPGSTIANMDEAYKKNIKNDITDTLLWVYEDGLIEIRMIISNQWFTSFEREAFVNEITLQNIFSNLGYGTFISATPILTSAGYNAKLFDFGLGQFSIGAKKVFKPTYIGDGVNSIGKYRLTVISSQNDFIRD